VGYACQHHVRQAPEVACGQHKQEGGWTKKTIIEYAINYFKANTPLAQDLYNDDVGNTGLFLCSGLQRCVTGSEFERWERCSGACGVQQQQQHDLVDGTIAWLTLLKYNKIHTYIINIASW
jgi:hypothetical protein